MKNVHLVIQIALGIILGHGYVAGLLMKDNYYSGQKIDFGYCWPIVVYVIVILAINVIKWVLNTGDSENGRIETTGETS